MNYRLKIRYTREDARMPARATQGSAGYDIFAAEETDLYPGDIKKVGTGLAMEIPRGMVGLMCSRSGLASRGIRLAAGMNVIDEDYRGEVFVCLINDGENPHHVSKGDRIAQMVFTRYEPLSVACCENLTETGRGSGGFGSTGR